MFRDLRVAFVTLVVSASLCTPAIAEPTVSPQHAACGAPAQPLLSVADFDGDGVVDGHDIAWLAKAIHGGEYYAFYDRNADAKLDVRDLRAAVRDLRKRSSAFDRELAAAFKRFHRFQLVRTPTELLQLGFQPGAQPLQGHGVHWLSQAGVASTQGLKPADVTLAEGLNVPMSGDSVWAMFWGDPAQPLFEDPMAEGGLSALDYPAPGGAWEHKPVQAFATMPRRFFSSPNETWHPHAGLCAVAEDHGAGPQIVLHQHTSFAQCQAMPSVARTGIASQNAWMNFWMMHLWMFKLNPNGVFGNTHPCLDPTAPTEASINEGRPVPPFFEMHGGH